MSLLSRSAALREKCQRVFQSDLIVRDKFRYVLDEILSRVIRHSRHALREYRLDGGATISLRSNSTDPKVFDEIFLERIYAPFARLIPSSLKLHTLVDLGANIGLSAIFLARELHLSDVVAVEPDRDNFALLQRNLARSGLLKSRDEPNVRAIQSFAGAGRGFAEVVDSGNGAWGLRMGAVQPHSHSVAFSVPVLPLTELLPDHPAPTGILLKCDIEGAERDLFPTIRDWDDRVDFIILELHTEFFTADQLLQSLKQSHFRWYMHGEIPKNAVLAVIALERRERKPEPTRQKTSAFAV